VIVNIFIFLVMRLLLTESMDTVQCAGVMFQGNVTIQVVG